MKGLLFSAGLGTRFKPWTDKHPKALAMVNGKSLLQRNIEYFQRFGITEVVVNVHHFADQIIEAIEENKGWGCNVVISDERDEVLETGGGLLKARPLLEGDEPFVTINVDILTNLNLHALLAYHQQHKPLVSFAVTNRKTARNFLFDDADHLCGWRNVTTGEEKGPVLSYTQEEKKKLIEKAYSCVVVFEQRFFSLVKQTGKFSLTEPYLDLAAEHTILGYDHSGDVLVDVGRPESVAVAEANFK